MVRYEKVDEADRQGDPVYAAMVESVDDSVGRVMAALRDLEIEDRTLVVFTSDNGGFAKATENAVGADPMEPNPQYEGPR